MKLGRRKKRMETTVELNITAFLNLMVILVPFLLITAVFSRMTILELNLPLLDSAPSDDKKEQPEKKLQLQLWVTSESITVSDAVLGSIKTIKWPENGVDSNEIEKTTWKPLRELLIELKRRFPEAKNITLLFEKNVAYKTMIAVMDRVKSADVVQGVSLEAVELFPVVSIGDAPALQALNSTGVNNE